MIVRLAGIDGCKRGWVVVHWMADSRSAPILDFTEDLDSFLVGSQIGLAVIDIPIGFSSGPQQRNVEAAMRKFLPGKTSSVFNTPCRQALYEKDYVTASAVNRDVVKVGLSKQTHAIFPKMREIDGLVRRAGQSRLREGHPEVSFAAMNGNRPVVSRKKDSAGESERIALLEAVGIPAKYLLDIKRRLGVARDDVLDAAALIWTAGRLNAKGHLTFPPVPSRDLMGLEMSVVA